MPRRGENIYKRKDGRWEARILKADGKFKSVYGKSYRDAKEKQRNYQEQIQPKGRPEFADDISGLFEDWLSCDTVQQTKPSTYEYYYRCIHGYVIPYFKTNKSKQITELSVRSFVKSLMNNNVLSDAYKRKILSVFKTALRKILNGSADSLSILDAVKLPKIQKEEILVFTMKEQRLLENTILQYHDCRTFGILLSLYTGLRLGELCALKWSDIDFDARTMAITKTISRIKDFKEDNNKTALYVGTPKSQNSLRKIPVPKFLIHILEECRPIDFDNCFFISGASTPLDPRTYQKLYKRVLTKACVKYRKFHALRHTFATRGLELGIDIKTLSEILGHSNVSITLNIYAHSLIEQKIIAINKFNDLHTTYMQNSLISRQ